MNSKKDPFEIVVMTSEGEEFAALTRKRARTSSPIAASGHAVTARLDGFGLGDEPILTDVPGLTGENVTARTTVALTSEMRGATVVVLFDGGDPRRPIVVGVLQDRPIADTTTAAPVVSVDADGDRLILTAEREIVLRCGEASITLTRAGKVIIKGAYIVSRSSGYNKIKGAAVDIN